MKSVKNKQLIVIAGVIVVIVLLLLANTKLPEKKEASAGSSEHAGNASQTTIASIVDNIKSGLSPQQKQKMEALEQALTASEDKKTAYETIVATWDTLRQPLVAAYYVEQAAQVSSTAKNWEEAGRRYYMTTRFLQETERPLLYKKAIACFEKAVALEPANAETKISLAACYVEGSDDPMKGIGMLKEVEKTDSNNVNLQLSFAFFSEKSGQWDKAIARFNKILTIEPDFIEAYLHLADAYQNMGNKEGALESLKKYVNLVDDVTIKTEVQSYIDQLSREDEHEHEHNHGENH